MLINYQAPPLEQWIEELYNRYDITKPKHLSIEVLAKYFNIWVHYHAKRSKGIELSEGTYTVFIDSRQSQEVQWLEFLHELCHLLRHAGNQTLMPEQFTKAQEYEADRFVFYAAIPFFMVHKIILPLTKGEAIGYIAREFRVPLHFAEQRFEQIEDRIAQAKFLSSEINAIAEQAATYTCDAPSEDISGIIHIKAFYDWDGDYSRPHTLVIEQPDGFDWDKPLIVEVNHNYKSCDLPTYLSRESAIVMSGDLDICQNRKDCVTINLSRVTWRHGKSLKRLYLPMEAIDDAINF